MSSYVQFYLLLLQSFSGVVWQTGDLRPWCNTLYLLSPRLCFFVVIPLDLSVDREGSLAGWRVVVRAAQPAGCVCRVSYGG